ncbi:MAG: alpha-beta hydrolase superfamily lysophospholipase [Vicingaceae bacterium]|jgi:alpha-beta hydrolase superfamily lysophospholipase
MMSNWVYIGLVVLAIYIGVSILLYYLQDYLLFKPEKLDKDFQYFYDNQEVEEYNIETRDGALINGLHFKVANPKGVVLYLKGNSKSMRGWGKFAVDFTRHDYDVFMIDYRGFGKSTGRRTQKALKNDLQLIYNKMKEKVDEKYIILYGRSLGSGFATKLASTNQPRMLILDAPYYSLSKVTARYAPFMPMSVILKYPIPTYKCLKYVECPIHIIHGTNDNLIPFKSSVKLSKIRQDQTRLYAIIGGGHKNLNTFESYHKMLAEIINTKPTTVDLETTSHRVKHNSKK